MPAGSPSRGRGALALVIQCFMRTVAQDRARVVLAPTRLGLLTVRREYGQLPGRRGYPPASRRHTRTTEGQSEATVPAGRRWHHRRGHECRPCAADPPHQRTPGSGETTAPARAGIDEAGRACGWRIAGHARPDAHPDDAGTEHFAPHGASISSASSSIPIDRRARVVRPAPDVGCAPPGGGGSVRAPPCRTGRRAS